MASIIFFDTETSGLSPENNEILQLSFLIADSKTWETDMEFNFYFPYPEDESRVSQRAIEVNHLTKEFLAEQTLSDPRDSLSIFISSMMYCNIAVAHNMEFDKSFIVKTASRVEEPISQTINPWPCLFDTMKETTELCKIPSTNGYDDYKWPRLEELADFLGVQYPKENLHDARADVKLTFDCFRTLCEKGYVKIVEDENGNFIEIRTPHRSPTFTMLEECGENSEKFKACYNYLVSKVQLGIITPRQLKWLKNLDAIKQTNEESPNPHPLDIFITNDDLKALAKDFEKTKKKYNI